MPLRRRPAERRDDAGFQDPEDAVDALTNDDAPAIVGDAIAEPESETDLGRSSIRRNVAHMLSSQVVTWSLALALAVVQPRFLGPAVQGQLRLGFSLWTIAAVVIGLGTSMYLHLEIARRGRAALELVGAVIALRLMTYVAMAALFVVGMVVGGADRDFVLILSLVGATILVTVVSEVYAAVFIGLERMSAPAIVNIVVRFCGTSAAVVVLFAGGKAVAVLIVMLVAQLIGLALIVRALHRVVDVPLRIGRSHWRTIVRASYGFMLAGAALTLYQQVDTIVIALLVEERVLGWYATADALFGTLLFLPSIVCTTVFPTLGRLAEHDHDAMVQLARRIFATLALVGVPLGLGTVIIAHDAAPLLYGSEFRETGGVLAVLGVVLIITTATILLATIAMASGRQMFWNLVMLIAALITIPLDIVLVPWADRTFDNGAIGGALAYVVTELMMLGVGLSRIAPYLVDRTSLRRVGLILLAGGAMTAVAWPTRDLPLPVTVLVAVAVYCTAVMMLRVLGDEERELLRRVAGRLGLRGRTPAA